MKFAVIGCGSIGQRHISNLLLKGYDVAGWNRGYEKRKLVERKYSIKTYSEKEKLIKEFHPECVFICTPNNLHIQDALYFAEKGCDLFIEKPLGISIRGLNKLENLIQAKELICHVGCNMRFHFGPASVKLLLDQGKIGRPIHSTIWGGMHLPDWHPDEDYKKMYSSLKEMGGGAVFDFIHEIDIMLWLFGEKVQTLKSIIGNSNWLGIETEDIVDSIFKFRSGLQVNMHLDYLYRPFQRGIKIIGEKGWVEWDLVKSKVIHYDHIKKLKTESLYPEGYNKNSMYLKQLEYFLSCIKGRNKSDSNLSNGIKALKLALRIKDEGVF